MRWWSIPLKGPLIRLSRKDLRLPHGVRMKAGDMQASSYSRFLKLYRIFELLFDWKKINYEMRKNERDNRERRENKERQAEIKWEMTEKYEFEICNCISSIAAILNPVFNNDVWWSTSSSDVIAGSCRIWAT